MQNDTISFLAKVVIFSFLLSLLIKYAGPLLPLPTPFTESLNGLVTAVVIAPSLLIGVLLIRASR